MYQSGDSVFRLVTKDGNVFGPYDRMGAAMGATTRALHQAEFVAMKDKDGKLRIYKDRDGLFHGDVTEAAVEQYAQEIARVIQIVR